MNDTTKYDGKINDVFANIYKTRITTGLLRDDVMELIFKLRQLYRHGST
ncbi:hypothetical protein [Hydrotalea sp. AMD]|nr:hypothetical protein [Hydrotalea sp. AMD]